MILLSIIMASSTKFLTVPEQQIARGIFGALLLEQNDESAVQRARYMTLETISQIGDDPLISLPAVAR
jgi:hypothetical protein